MARHLASGRLGLHGPGQAVFGSPGRGDQPGLLRHSEKPRAGCCQATPTSGPVATRKLGFIGWQFALLYELGVGCCSWLGCRGLGWCDQCCDEWFDQARSSLFSEPVAISSDCEHLAVMEQSIEDRGSDHLITKDLSPLHDRAIGGDQHLPRS